MEEQEKPFNIVWIIILIMIALANDAAEIFFDLLAMTGVGLVGETIMEPVNALLDSFFTVIFFIKCGFGGPTIIQLVQDVLELLGIPGRTLCVIAGIVIANNPKLEKVAELAAVVEAGSAAGELTEAEEAAGATAKTAATAETSAAEGATAEVGEAAGGKLPSSEAVPEGETAAEGRRTEPEKESIETERESREAERPGEEKAEGEEAEGENKQKEEELEKELETKEERPPEEVLGEELFEGMPEAQTEEEEDVNEESGGNESKKPEDQGATDDQFAKGRKALEVKRQLQKIKEAKEATADTDEDTLKKAA